MFCLGKDDVCVLFVSVGYIDVYDVEFDDGVW